MAQLLHRPGREYILAGALEEVAGDYDIILLDLNLPDMHGYDVLKKLRAAKVGTPVLILSGIGEMDSKVRALGFGADDYLTKPFNKGELIARIQAIVRRSKGHSESIIRTGKLSDEDWEKMSVALGKLHEAPIHIDETGALNASDLRARARRLHRQFGPLGLIVVDYLQLMTSLKDNENRATEISEISRSIKAITSDCSRFCSGVRPSSDGSSTTIVSSGS